MSDVEQTDALANMVMAGNGTYGTVGQRHGVPSKGHHLCIILNMKIVQAGLLQLVQCVSAQYGTNGT
jgi:hypothetical protein